MNGSAMQGVDLDSLLNRINRMRLAPLTTVADDLRTMLRDGFAPRRQIALRARTNDVSVKF
ncbi:hypothetical protein X551_02565 [Methylibium sp. T29]|nr:hypothetical protein X551_02565 [Methylibium sp. T29]EWS58941.1 hypothetical protein Y694_03218 [Methylibium sp. T29-B]